MVGVNVSNLSSL